MREYELMFIVAQDDVKEGFHEQLIEEVRADVEQIGGRILRIRPWGLRELAHDINKHSRGYYVIIQLLVDVDKLPDLEFKLKSKERILRYMFTFLEDRGEQDVKILEQMFDEEEVQRTAT